MGLGMGREGWSSQGSQSISHLLLLLKPVNKSDSPFLPLKHGQVSTEGSEWELEILVIVSG